MCFMRFWTNYLLLSQKQKISIFIWFLQYLPPAYGVRREGYVLTRVCLSVTGGGGQVQPAGGRSGPADGGGGQVQLTGGSGPADGGGGWGPADREGGWGPASGGGVRSSQPGGGQVQPTGGGGQVQPTRGGQVQPGGGGSAKIGQHMEYLLHGGRYASCVHARGLSCLIMMFFRWF